ncbi:MAG: phosphoribosylamine--glycine ligase [Betaproteobacteria bacterium]|nr:phosphoribosylamine--glycine ligase [Betaproteobacteria bacterium]
MKILVIGSGGREHALAWKLSHSARVKKVFVAPGNGGTAGTPRLENLPITDIERLADFCVAEDIHLTVVGPEAPLAAGVVDHFRMRKLRIFGPTRAAARLESSKAYAKEFMQRHGIPTAGHRTFTDPQAAHAYIDERACALVVKADGLAAGKGVVVASTPQEAHAAVDDMLERNVYGVQHGEAGARVVIEDFLEGEEASFIVLVNGNQVLPLASSQDHKRLRDGDQGPNTGGMGAYSPAPVVTPEVHARVMREIIVPTVQGMAADGHPYTGFLYAGLMIDRQGQARTLEFNCRLGDPETQPILMRLKSDLVQVLDAAIDSRLDGLELQWDRRTALAVVMAAPGYPEAPELGGEIQGIPAPAEDLQTFHAGTRLDAGVLRTSGGRVLAVTALGDSLRMAQARAYTGVRQIRFEGMQFRQDIGWRALKR